MMTLYVLVCWCWWCWLIIKYSYSCRVFVFSPVSACLWLCEASSDQSDWAVRPAGWPAWRESWPVTARPRQGTLRPSLCSHCNVFPPQQIRNTFFVASLSYLKYFSRVLCCDQWQAGAGLIMMTDLTRGIKLSVRAPGGLSRAELGVKSYYSIWLWPSGRPADKTKAENICLGSTSSAAWRIFNIFILRREEAGSVSEFTAQ